MFIDTDAKIHFYFDLTHNQFKVGCESKLFQSSSEYNIHLQSCFIPGKIYWNQAIDIDYISINIDDFYYFHSATTPNLVTPDTMNQEVGLTSYKIKPIAIDFSTDQYSLDLSNTRLPLAVPILQEIDIPQKIEGITEGQIIFNSSKSQLQSYTKQFNWKSFAFQQTVYNFPLIPIKNDDWYINNNVTNTTDFNITVGTDPFTTEYTIAQNQLPVSGTHYDYLTTYYFEYRMNKHKFFPEQTFKITPLDMSRVIWDTAGNTPFFYNEYEWKRLDVDLNTDNWRTSPLTDYVTELHAARHNAYLIRIRLPDCTVLEDWEILKYCFVLNTNPSHNYIYNYAEIEFATWDLNSCLYIQDISSATNFNTVRTVFDKQSHGDRFEFTIMKDNIFVNPMVRESGAYTTKFNTIISISAGH